MTRAVATEPHRVLTSAAIVGLVIGPRAGMAPTLAAALVLVIVLRHMFAGSAGLAAGAVLLLIAGAVFAEQRTALLARTALPLGSAQEVTGTVTLLDAFRQDASGPGARALARFRGEPVLLRVRTRPPPVSIGALMRIAGTLEPPDRGARARHAHATFVVRRVRVTGARRGGVAGTVDGVRTRATVALATDLPQDVGALLTGMVLGQDAALSLALQDDMRTTSLSHLTAASGQNVALLAAMASGLGIVLGFGVRGRWALALLLTALYVPLAGGGPSITRAGIMGGAAIAAAMAGRPSSRADALLLAAVLTLAIDPRSAGDLGWQLSFAAVIGIAILTGPISQVLRRGRLPRAAAQVLAVTVAATIATAPVLAVRVGPPSPIAVPANVLAAPAVPLVMGAGAAAATVGQVWPAGARPLRQLAAIPTAYVAAVGRRLAHLPRPRILGGDPVPPVPPRTLRMTALDIGQGDATLLEASGARILVDTGPPGLKLRRALDSANVARLDLVVLTHAQLDHIGDAPRLLRETPVSVVLDGRGDDRSELSRSIDGPLAAHRTRVVRAAAGQQLTIGAMRLRVLWPPAGRAVPGTDPNDRAVVLAVEAYGYRVLMTADAESNVLGPLRLAAADVLKVSHHGSADPGLPGLLQRLRPRLAVIEVGKGNSYGHPTPATLGALSRARVPVARTDQDGTVRVDLGPTLVRLARRAGP